MATILNNSGSEEVELYYTDEGAGKPVILIHGWPLSHESWKNQIQFLSESGFRVIAYDRRGFGESASAHAYDYDVLASDLHTIIENLDLNNVSLVGFSMGGGEVVRYLSNYGTDRISKIALIASIIPLVKQKSDNPDGVPQEDLDEILEALQDDRVDFLQQFHQQFYNVDQNPGNVSQQQLDADLRVSSAADPEATIAAAKAWMDTDFRAESERITVPTLIVHGKEDQTVPIGTSGDQAAKLIKNSTYTVYDDAPHGLNVTHADKLNKDLLEFLQSES